MTAGMCSRVLVVSRNRVLEADALGTVGHKVGLQWTLNQIWIWGILTAPQNFKLFVTILWQFLSSFCSVSLRINLLGDPMSWKGLYVPWGGGMLGVQRWLGQMVWVKRHPHDCQG